MDDDLQRLFEEGVAKGDELGQLFEEGVEKPKGKVWTKTVPSKKPVELEPEPPPEKGLGEKFGDWIFPDKGTNPLAAIAAGGQSGLLRGWGDELQGVVGALAAGEPTLERYRAERDQAREFDEMAKRSHPWLFDKAEFGGTMANEALAAGLTGGASATPLGQAVTGGVEGLGKSQADLTRPSVGNIGRAALDTGVSALTSAGGAKLGQIAAPYVQRGMGWAGDKLEKFASERALKASGAIQAALKKMSREKQRQAGIDMIREGLIPFGAKPDVIYERAAELSEKTGKEIGALLKTVDEATGKRFDWNELYETIHREFEALDPTDRTVVGNLVDKLDDLMGTYQKEGGGFEAANRFKTKMQQLIGNYIPDPKVQQSVKNQITGWIRENVDTQLAREFGNVVGEVGAQSSQRVAGSPKLKAQVAEKAAETLGERWAELKRLYGIQEMTEKLAEAGANRVAGNRWASLTDYMTGLTAGGAAGGGALHSLMSGDPVAALGGLAVGAGATLVHKGARERGAAMLANPSLWLSDLAKEGAEAGGEQAAGILGAEAARRIRDRFKGGR